MALLRLKQLTGHFMIQTSSVSTVSADKVARVLASRRNINVLDSSISYLDTGEGDKTVVFLHGNPTSSYLWRNIIPHVNARCIAPDLIGMGQSGKQPQNQYRFVDHYRYLSEWIDKMNLEGKLHFVVHDWGSALGFHWCNLHRNRVGSITFFEALVHPMPSWDQFPEASRDFFRALRSSKGEEMVLKKNLFVKLLLPNAVLRELTKEEMSCYLAPYLEEGESRRPTLTWPREIPVTTDGPQDVVDIATSYHKWLSGASDVPKLFINVEPGFFNDGVYEVVKHWPNLTVAHVKGHHFAQEDSPTEIGQAIQEFLHNL